MISSRYFRALTMVLVLGLLLMPTAVFAAEELDAVHGTVFHDLNQDGILDPGEVGILGVTIELYESDLFVASTTTDVDGFYEFSELDNGSYTVKEINLENYVSTTLDEVEFAVNSPTPALTVDFGDVPAAELASISGTVYDDLNRSRSFDNGEEGLVGVTVLLKDSEGLTLDSTFTDDLGFYSFDELFPGEYSVRELDPDGYYSTTAHEVLVDLLIGENVVVNFGDFVPEPGEVSPIDLPITRFFHLPLLDVLELRSIDKLGYGNIAKVYFLSYLSGWEIGDILDLLDGNGWGNVMKEVLGKAGLKGYNLGLIMSGREMPNQVSKVMEGCDLIETQEDYQALLALGGNQGQIKKLCREVMEDGGSLEDLKDALEKPHGYQPVNHPGNDDNNGNGPPACKGTNKKDPGCE